MHLSLFMMLCVEELEMFTVYRLTFHIFIQIIYFHNKFIIFPVK